MRQAAKGRDWRSLREWSRLSAASAALLVLAAIAAALHITQAAAEEETRAGTSKDAGAGSCEVRYRLRDGDRVFAGAAASLADCQRLAARDAREYCRRRDVSPGYEVSARASFGREKAESLFSLFCGRRMLLRRTGDGPLMDGDLVVYEDETDRLQRQVLDLLGRSDFDGLEALEGSLRGPGAKSSIGASKRPLFYWAFRHQVDARAVREEVEYWIEKRPTSAVARTALLQVLLGMAWEARGRGFADSVSDEGAGGFERLAREALDAGERARELAPRDPLVVAYLIAVGQALGQGRPVVDGLFSEGVKLDPRNGYLHRAMALYLHPWWYGSEEAFVEAARRARREAGVAVFLQIVTSAMNSDARGFAGMFPGWWGEVKAAFEEWEKQQPKSAYFREWLAWGACHYQDREAARRVFGELGERWNADTRYVWRSKEALRSAREWAARDSGVWALPRSPQGSEAMGERCEAGSARDCLRLARLHKKGGGAVGWDPERACALFQKACRLGELGGCSEAVDCMTGGHRELADRELLRAMILDLCAARGIDCTAELIQGHVNDLVAPTPTPMSVGTHCFITLRRAGRILGRAEADRGASGECLGLAREKAQAVCQEGHLAAATAIDVLVQVQHVGGSGQVSWAQERFDWQCQGR